MPRPVRTESDPVMQASRLQNERDECVKLLIKNFLGKRGVFCPVARGKFQGIVWSRYLKPSLWLRKKDLN